MVRIAYAGRRRFLQRLAAQGLLIPAAGAAAHAPGTPYEPSVPLARRPRPIIRDFADPYLELLRLLRQACDVEHALMVQYLYGALSVKPAYAAIVGSGAPGTNDLLGIAVMEMQHLRQVNELLAALGGTPSLLRDPFPQQPEVYPFPFALEPLTRHSLAKYVFCEAAAGSLRVSRNDAAAERHFVALLEHSLGPDVRPNHVGSLYDAIIHTLEEYIAGAKAARLRPWIARLKTIKQDGEVGHFQFFKRVFLAEHDAFGGRDAWSLTRSDAAYPSYALPVNPSAFVGHANQIDDPRALALAWLGNLHYWTVLLLVELSYRDRTATLARLAQAEMLGPLWSIARHLPTLGAGMPFEPLATGYSPCQSGAASRRFIAAMAREAQAVEKSVAQKLPADYPFGMGDAVLAALAA
jgi:hypothetical protein